MTREDYVRKFYSDGSEREWNDLIRDVKREHGGQYPVWWYEAMIASGIVARKAREFNNELRIIVE